MIFFRVKFFFNFDGTLNLHSTVCHRGYLTFTLQFPFFISPNEYQKAVLPQVAKLQKEIPFVMSKSEIDLTLV